MWFNVVLRITKNIFKKVLPVKVRAVDCLSLGDPDTSGYDWLLFSFFLSWLVSWLAPFSEVNLFEIFASEILQYIDANPKTFAM